MTTNTMNQDTDLLPEEQALLDGKTLNAAGNIVDSADDDTGTGDDAGLSADALAAIAAKGERTAGADDSGTEPAAPAQAAPAPAYNVADPAKFDETRQALLAKRAGAMKELMDGVMEPDAFAAIDSEVMSGLEQLTINRTLHEANVQQEQARMQAALSTIMADGAAKGVDYAGDPALQALFDTKMRAIATRDDMAGKTAAEIYQATHAEVLRMFGKGTAAPSPSPAPAANAPAAAPAAAAPAPKPQIPPTLGQMPNAAPVDIGADLTTTLMGMDDPDQAEAMLARMAPAQRNAALRATVGTTPLRRSGAQRGATAEA
jgi:hypothetical protein